MHAGFLEQPLCRGPRRSDVVRETRKGGQLGFRHRQIGAGTQQAADIFELGCAASITCRWRRSGSLARNLTRARHRFVMRYLLDTNIISDALKPQPPQPLSAWIENQKVEELFIPTFPRFPAREGHRFAFWATGATSVRHDGCREE